MFCLKKIHNFYSFLLKKKSNFIELSFLNLSKCNYYNYEEKNQNSAENNSFKNKYDKNKNKSKPINFKKNVFDIEPGKNKSNFDVSFKNQYEILNILMCPLSNLSYEDQLKIKNRRVFLFLKHFSENLIKYGSKINLDESGYPCFTEEIIPLEKHSKYLNKDEFSIYFDVNKQVTVGYFIGSFNKNVICVEPKNLVFCKSSHKNLAKEFQTYLQQKSKIKVSKILNNRTWSTFSIRSNDEGDHLCIIKLFSDKISETDLNKEKIILKDYFLNIKDKYKIVSLYIEYLDKKTKNLEHLFGEKKLKVKFNEKIFRLSPKSFMPLNFESYKLVTKCALEDFNLQSKEGIIEVHPFIGFLTVEIANYVKNIIAIDTCDEALNNLSENLIHNQIFNVSLKTENVLKNILSVLDLIYYKHTIIINLYKDQINSSVITQLRFCKYIKKIIIISKPNDILLKMSLHLCLENSNKEGIFGLPFSLIHVIPIDNQPCTNSFHLIFIFERL